jgi:NADH:ubiquinone oxidoreductase subunit B-like Fe-S oxidoreductase
LIAFRARSESRIDLVRERMFFRNSPRTAGVIGIAGIFDVNRAEVSEFYRFCLSANCR